MKLLSRIFNRKLFLIIVLTLLLPVAPGFAGNLSADISLQFGPGVSLYYSDYPRYGYAPPPVYYAPPPVYYAPPPVYYAPPPPRSYWRSNRYRHYHDRPRHHRYQGDRGYRRDRGYSRRDRRW